ncbi:MULTISPECIES: cellulose binding domain-containing protein [unclassified Streptomyces]|uniref:cellulose binding domain-containing protein n=1 Tax=unclassified Streptomyces TaxID=2593676 RepID=UPI0006FAEF14|nr:MULTISPECIES: cellulose binding domain-containing protein [unclassified Streptomyces]KQX56954.1 hydrolase [Streptomyces sp. Root1304]KRA98535.1 hydrolase [Streptomyces sp. Root66D1]
MRNGTSRRKTGMRTALAAATAVIGLGATSLTASPAAAAEESVAVLYRQGGAGSDQAAPWFTVANTGTTNIPLSQVKLRYYFKADPGASYSYACDWAVRGCTHLTGTFGRPANPTATADRYLEVGFTAGAGSLAPGADTGDVQLRFHRSDWQPLDQSDDYSFGPAQTTYGNWTQVTATIGGVQVWGTAPAGKEATPTPTPTPTDPSPTTPATPPAEQGVLFDDFDYTGHTDPAITAHGWTIRSGGGGPGVGDATWAPENVTFAKDGTNSVMTLRTSTAGTGTSTRQTEVHTAARKFKNGTYAARVHFTDTPTSGPDGDHLVQSFFTINDLTAPMADDYAEYDFEYLPNGGWGETANVLYTTSWETFRPDPWEAVNQHTEARTSQAGWHDLVLTIDDRALVYYIDGKEFARHDARYLPERPMSIHFNQWLIDLAGQTSTTTRAYEERIDYMLHVKDEVLTPAQVAAKVAAYRSNETAFEDSVPAS